MNSSSNRTISSRIDHEIWKLNKENTTITKDIQQLEFLKKLYKDEHQFLVQRISQLDQLIRAHDNFIKAKEQEIITNTRRLEQLKTHK